MACDFFGGASRVLLSGAKCGKDSARAAIAKTRLTRAMTCARLVVNHLFNANVAFAWLQGNVRRLCHVELLFATFYAVVSTAAQAATGTWESSGSLSSARFYHTATRLASGQVLVSGGQTSSTCNCYLSSAELYSPQSNEWSPAGSMATSRQGDAAVLLLSGRVFVVGGQSDQILASTELYDPASNTWFAAAPLMAARFNHTATLLPSGKVLVVGGNGNAGSIASAELYDPSTNTWTAAASLKTPRQAHTATLLSSGKLLVAGGLSNIGGISILASAELYDPTTNTWSAAGSMVSARNGHSATLLPSGQVLVAGGESTYAGNSLASAELYDPASNSWLSASSMETARSSHTASLLPSGKVLVEGGFLSNTGQGFFFTELYDPTSNVWTSAANPTTPRLLNTATLLSSGELLIAGGVSFNGSTTLNSAELYIPSAAISVAVTSNALGGYTASLQSQALTPNSTASSSLNLQVASTVTMVATGSSPITLTVTASTSALATLTLVDRAGNEIGHELSDSPYGSLSALSQFTYDSNAGKYTATATYTPPTSMPANVNVKAFVGLRVNQGTLQNPETHIILGTPPLLLFHGLWSDACSMQGLLEAARATAALEVFAVNYGSGVECERGGQIIFQNNYGVGVNCGDLSAKDFAATGPIQDCVATQISDLASALLYKGFSFSKFDAIGHSMGGLVAAIYAKSASQPNSNLPQIGSLVSIGTPWNGSPLANMLANRKLDPLNVNTALCTPGALSAVCAFDIALAAANTDVESLLAFVHHPINDGAIDALADSTKLADASTAGAPPLLKAQIAGIAATSSPLKDALNLGLDFVADPNTYPPGTVDTMMNTTDHDLIVPLSSAAPFALTPIEIPATHFAFDPFSIKSLTSWETGGAGSELGNSSVWNAALCALGATQDLTACTPPYGITAAMPASAVGTDELADLVATTITGSQLSPESVTISAPQPVTPFSDFTASVTGTGLCTPQTTFVADSNWILREYVGDAPTFSLPAGTNSSTSSTWLVVCTSGDYVATTASFAVAAPTITSLTLTPDSDIIQPGETDIVRAVANYMEGSMDVTGSASNATYSALGPATYLGDGAYRATKYGMIFVTVSYGGQNAVAVIKVGADELYESGFE